MRATATELRNAAILTLLAAAPAFAASGVSGRVLDPQGNVVPGAAVRLDSPLGYHASATADRDGRYCFLAVPDGDYRIQAEAPGLSASVQRFTLADHAAVLDLKLSQVAAQHQSVVITATAVEPEIDMRNAEVFDRTLFTRDDQALQQLDAGIDAGQHEGGGKSLEIRRFGFNLDHGGVNGGLKVLVDDVQQNQETQGHGQGYLGALKALSPELIQDVTITNGPFQAEYGDFSGLGRGEHPPARIAARPVHRAPGGRQLRCRPRVPGLQPRRGPRRRLPSLRRLLHRRPFLNPLRYRRDNLNGNYTAQPGGRREDSDFAFSTAATISTPPGRSRSTWLAAGLLNRFGYIDPTDGGRIWLGTASAYFSQNWSRRRHTQARWISLAVSVRSVLRFHLLLE